MKSKKTNQSKTAKTGLNQLKTFDRDLNELNVIAETPKGSRNKFKYDEEQSLFKLGGVLPIGSSFPFDFGFIPSTLGEDGDPLDALILMDEPAFPGCIIASRLIGVIEAEQTQEGKTERNDRLIAVASTSRIHQSIEALSDVDSHLLDEIEHFFISYNEVKGKEFKPLARAGPKRAREIVEEGIQRFKTDRSEKE
jgi:inorganic pyrophosphatase